MPIDGPNVCMHFEPRMEKLFKGVYSTMYRGHLVEIELRPLADFSYDAVFCCRDNADAQGPITPAKETQGFRQIRTVEEYHALFEELKTKVDVLVDGSKAKPAKAPFSFQYRIRT